MDFPVALSYIMIVFMRLKFTCSSRIIKFRRDKGSNSAKIKILDKFYFFRFTFSKRSHAVCNLLLIMLTMCQRNGFPSLILQGYEVNFETWWIPKAQTFIFQSLFTEFDYLFVSQNVCLSKMLGSTKYRATPVQSLYKKDSPKI